ncbi:MAG: Mur ligase family protein [Eubacteriales bacterium]
MKINELLEDIKILKAYNHKDLDINQIAYHSKNVDYGSIFVCIKGYQTDGHKYVEDAIKNGAAAIIVEDYQEGLNIPQYVVSNSRKALSSLADKFYGYPSKDMKVIGITATNGKTTTTFMINNILESYKLNTGLIGSVIIKYGEYAKPSYLTTPQSKDLQSILYNMNNNDITHVCMEVSSSALELNRVENVDYDIVSLHNISSEHIDLHGSFEQYYNAKARLIREAKSDAWAILNLDDKYSASLLFETKAKVITYGIERKTGHISCNDLDLSTGRAKFTVQIKKPIIVDEMVYEKCEFPIILRTPGYHSVHNAMVAILVGLLNKVPIEIIQKGLRTFGGVERRFEIIYDEDFIIIDDHFANPGNIDVSLKTLKKMNFDDLKLVYALRGNRGITVMRDVANTIIKWAPKLGINEIITSLSKSYTTSKDEVMKEEIEVFNSVLANGGIKVRMFEELEDAVFKGLKEIKEGDVLMLAGCQGMDMGAKIALEQIYKMKPNKNEKILFAPIEKRVAGC